MSRRRFLLPRQIRQHHRISNMGVLQLEAGKYPGHHTVKFALVPYIKSIRLPGLDERYKHLP